MPKPILVGKTRFLPINLVESGDELMILVMIMIGKSLASIYNLTTIIILYNLTTIIIQV